MHLSTAEAVLEYDVKEPTHFCFNLQAAQWPTQNLLSEHLEVTPGIAVRSYVDARSGNRFLRFDAPTGPLRLHYKADVEVFAESVDAALAEAPVREVPDDIFPWLLATRYCESDRMAAQARQLFGTEPPGLARVRAIVQWVHEHIAYRPGSTGPTTTASEVLAQRAGVCRDFAHLAITFCRALSIPARMVVGYVWFDEPPQDFHAVFEAWLGGRWVLFDATGMAPVDRLVRIGTGGDAKDVAFCTYFGNVALLRKEVWVLEHDPRAAPSGPALAPAAPVPADSALVRRVGAIEPA